jgi:hypothetical protein
MATTTNYGWSTPDDTALVSQGAAAIRTLGSSADTTVKALSPGTTAGDVDYYTSSTAKARLGIGSSGQVLTVAAGVPSWATPTSGSMTLISTTTLTGASITLSSIPQTYNDLYIVVRNFRPATDAENLIMRFNADASANRHSFKQNLSASGQSFASTQVPLTQGTDNGASTAFTTLQIPDYASATAWRMAQAYSVTNNPTTPTTFDYDIFWLFYNQTTAISSLQFYCGSGNFTSGTLLLYGVK